MLLNKVPPKVLQAAQAFDLPPAEAMAVQCFMQGSNMRATDREVGSLSKTKRLKQN